MDIEQMANDFDKSNSEKLPAENNKAVQVSEPKSKNTDELVDDVFNAAIVSNVSGDDDLKKEVINAAKKFTKTKLKIINNKVDTEDKQVNFNNKKSACECFGFDEDTTNKHAVNLMNYWHIGVTFLWILIGCFTYAPVVFIAKKISVIFKKTWIAIIFALLIYLTVIFVPFFITK